MTPAGSSPPEAAPRRRPEDVVALAGDLFRRFHSRCFWHSPRDLEITEELVPFVAKGLRTHGGREGFQLAGGLRIDESDSLKPRDDAPCP